MAAGGVVGVMNGDGDDQISVGVGPMLDELKVELRFARLSAPGPGGSERSGRGGTTSAEPGVLPVASGGFTVLLPWR